MRITLFGVLAVIGVVALLVYLGNEWKQTNQAKPIPPPKNPDSSTNP
jgi:hypothetical protein